MEKEREEHPQAVVWRGKWKNGREMIGVHGLASPKPGAARFRLGVGLKLGPINKWPGLALSGRSLKFRSA